MDQLIWLEVLSVHSLFQQMSSNDQSRISAIPTNIITGFLGVGKTTSILQLLKDKPADQRWAVLVNEFGEIGVDGSFLGGEHSEQQGVFIREVPGGCMCCAAGLPMQVALTRLIRESRPDRILIEPSGLGHPLEVLQALMEEQYREILAIEKVITLIDARKVTDERYTRHPTFNQQLAIADLVLASKQDLYQEADHDRLLAYLQQRGIQVPVKFIEQGQIQLAWLQGPTNSVVRQQSPQLPEQLQFESTGVDKVRERFVSIGWQFDQDTLFDYNRLSIFLNGIMAERMKAVFITERGIFAYNLSDGALSVSGLDDAAESRIEIITTRIDNSWESHLRDCIL